jgi:hydrogenase maturation protease
MSRPRVLVAGVGNIFFGDDAFGVEVARRLARRALPEGVQVVDFGIRGLDLAYALLDGYDAVVLVDAVPRGGRPGTLYVLEPTPGQVGNAGPAPAVEPHAMDPVKVLRLAESMGGRVGRLLLVGCEPTPNTGAAGGEVEREMQDGLSETVRAAVDEAVDLVAGLAARLARGEAVVAGGDGDIPNPGEGG